MTFPYPDETEENRSLYDMQMDKAVDAAEKFIAKTSKLRLQFTLKASNANGPDLGTACRFNHHAKKLSQAVGGLYSYQPLERSIILHAAVCHAKDLGGKITKRKTKDGTKITVTRQ